jgi:hypothetical protein
LGGGLLGVKIAAACCQSWWRSRYRSGVAARRRDWETRPWLTEERRGPASTVAAESRSNELLLILAFSGSGTRAAAFGYGVLEELAATPVVLGGRPRRLLDEVDLISAVAGGSFTAAYYGLYGDRVLHDFETEFLKRPVERQLVVQLLRTRNWCGSRRSTSTAASSRRSTTTSISSGARRSPIWSSEAAPRS